MIARSVLIVEDDDAIRELLASNLQKEGYRVVPAVSGEEALQAVEAAPVDLVLLDVMLPGVDGLTVCRRLREQPRTRSIPIVMLTAKTAESDIVCGLNLGADDYITKPFSTKVLLARVRAIFRRLAENEEGGNLDRERIRIHELVIDPRQHMVFLAGAPLELTRTEFELLLLMAGKPGWAFSRRQILDAVHGEGCPVTDRAVDVQILGLRRKLAAAGRYIETVHGVGYRFTPSPRSNTTPA